MNKKKIIGYGLTALVVVLIAVLIVSSAVGWGTPDPIYLKNEYRMEDYITSEEAVETASISNEYIKLDVAKDGSVTVTDLVTKKVFNSNPSDVWENDKLAGDYKRLAASQLVVTWANQDNNVETVYSADYSEENPDYGNDSFDEYTDDSEMVDLEELLKALEEETPPFIRITQGDNGIKVTYDFTKQKFTIPIFYKLSDHYFEVTILGDEIKETGDNQIIDISALPFMCSAEKGSDGYLFVPDGCGAVINFDNGRELRYEQNIYGQDTAEDLAMMTQQPANMPIPVFGMKNGTSGILGIITKGEAKAAITAQTTNVLLGSNYIYPKYRFRSILNIQLPTKNFQTQEIRLLEKNKSHNADFTVAYRLLSEPQNTYTGMARIYSEYFMTHNTVPAKAKNADVFLEFYGYVEKTKYIFGIPVKYNEKLTSFQDAVDMTEDFLEKDLQPAIKFNGFSSNEFIKNIPRYGKPDSSIGGSKELEVFKKYMNQNNVSAFMSLDIVNYYKAGNGFSKFKGGTRKINDVVYNRAEYQPNIFYKDTKKKWNMAAPSYLEGIVDRYLQNTKSLPVDGYALEELGTTVYSDFGSNGSTRIDTIKHYQNALTKLKGEKEIMVSGGNQYSLAYASHVFAAPVSSGNHVIIDYDVPFYQIAFGHIYALSAPPINLTSNPREAMLKCYEFGIAPSFSLVHDDAKKLKDTELRHLYNGEYSRWKDTILAMSTDYTAFRKKTGNSRITEHHKLADQVFETVYETGSVIVNYSENAYEADGVRVEKSSYMIRE